MSLLLPNKSSKSSGNNTTKIINLETPYSKDPDLFDESFIYPLVEMSGKLYTFIPEILYEKNSYDMLKDTTISDI